MKITQLPGNGNGGIVPPWMQKPKPPEFGIYPMPAPPAEPSR